MKQKQSIKRSVDVELYSNDYNTVLEEAQRDQNAQARPKLAEGVSVHYFGGSELPGDMEEWLKANNKKQSISAEGE